jgi:hypothetical protein
MPAQWVLERTYLPIRAQLWWWTWCKSYSFRSWFHTCAPIELWHKINHHHWHQRVLTCVGWVSKGGLGIRHQRVLTWVGWVSKGGLGIRLWTIDAKYPTSSSVRWLFFLSSCTRFSALHAFCIKLGGMVLHISLILQISLAAWQSSKFWSSNLADSKPGPSRYGTCYRPLELFQELCLQLFSISTTSTVKKSNPITEPHGSPQGCTVRPRKGAGQCSIGAGGGQGGI